MLSSMFGLRRHPVVLMGVLLTMTTILVAGGCRGGCRRSPPADGRPPGVLALFPAETRMVLAIDFRRIRDSRLWRELAGLARQDPQDKGLIEAFTARTGLDPFRQVHRVYAAFPEEARKDGAFGLYFEGEGFDEKRLLTYARDEARLRGQVIEQRLYRGRTLWTAPRPADPARPGSPGPEVAGFFLDGSRFVLAGGGWAERMIDLLGPGASPAASAAGNASLLGLAERVGKGRALWLAAIVPDGTRQRLMADPRFGVQASVMRFSGAADLAPAIVGELHADLSNADDARVMVERVRKFLREAKKSPQVLLLGAGPYLDALSAESRGSTATVKIRLDEGLTGELVDRLRALLQLRR